MVEWWLGHRAGIPACDTVVQPVIIFHHSVVNIGSCALL